jgi:hypothetical protein
MIKKKIILGVCISLMSVCASYANVYVNWAAGGGFYWSASTDSLFTPASGASALAQLIWSSDNIANTATFGSANLVSGNDYWLVDFTITEGVNTSQWGDFGAPLFNDNGTRPAGGFIYARIFQDAAPTVNDYYYVGPVIAAANLNPSGVPADSPQIYQMNTDLSVGNPIDVFQVAAVPEPGTMALFALGVATLAAARRRRKGVTA